MSRLDLIERIVIPRPVANRARTYLQRVGARGLEGVALWAGRQEGDCFRVSETIIPEQTPLRLPTGLLYVVKDDELHRINVHLYREDLTLIAQLHSHPSDAYHSPTDDAYPIVTSLGGISIVVPDFARGPFIPSAWAVYRLGRLGWRPLKTDQARELLHLEQE